jgi:hypothetical protein
MVIVYVIALKWVNGANVQFATGEMVDIDLKSDL